MSVYATATGLAGLAGLYAEREPHFQCAQMLLLNGVVVAHEMWNHGKQYVLMVGSMVEGG